MRCLDCENQKLFEHNVVGAEVRLYDDNGEYVDTEYQELKSTRVICAKCGSVNVRDQRKNGVGCVESDIPNSETSEHTQIHTTAQD